MKIAFVQDQVHITEPEINLLNFFKESEEQKAYTKLYTVVPQNEPVNRSITSSTRN